MKSTIICIGRQYGSGGREIGEKLAGRLGVVCYDKLLISRAARETGMSPETVAADEEKPIGLSLAVSGNPFADTATMGETFYSEKQRVFEAGARQFSSLRKKVHASSSGVARPPSCGAQATMCFRSLFMRTWKIVRNGLPSGAASARRRQCAKRKRWIGCAKNTLISIPTRRGAM